MPAKPLAHEIEAAGQRRVAKAAIGFAGERGADGRGQRFLWVGEFDLRLGQRAAIAPMVSLERCMTGLRLMEIETDGAGLRALGPYAMANGFFGVLRH